MKNPIPPISFRGLLVLLAMVPAWLGISAQSPDDLLHPETLNLKYLEHLVKLQIDSVRIAHGLNPLVNDSLLYIAADDHATYLRDNRTNGHYQKSKLKKTPQDRIRYYGGSPDYVSGENAISSFILKPTSTKKEKAKGKTHVANTYWQAAFDMMTGWVNSPGHYKNIITPHWEVTGLSIAYDPKTNNLKGVQLFAQVKFKYEFTEDKTLFPYADGHYPEPQQLPLITKYPHKLKNPNRRQMYRFAKDLMGPSPWDKHDPNKAPKKEIKAQLKAMDHLDFFTLSNEILTKGLPMGRSKTTQKGKQEVFRTFDPVALAKAVRKRKDGIALEIVTYEPYHCGNPHYEKGYLRKNKNTILTGQVLAPVYKKEILKPFKVARKQFKQKQKREIIKVKNNPKLSKEVKKAEIATLKKEPFNPEQLDVQLGRKPKDLTDYHELNVLFIHRKRVMWALHFTGFCGEKFEKNDEFPLLSNLRDAGYEPKPRTDTLTFTVPFAKNETDYQNKYIKPLMDSLVSESWIVEKARIEGYASVEGTRTINERLQTERAEAIVQAIEEVQQNPIEKEITAQENWELFRKQLKKSPYKAWLKKEEAEIKALLEDDNWERRMEPLLRKQRRADIKLWTQENIVDSNKYDFALRDYRESLKEAQKQDSTAKRWTSRAEAIQAYLFHAVLNGDLEAERVFAVELPKEGPFGRLWHNQMWLIWKLEHSGSNRITFNKEFFTSLKRLAKAEKVPGTATYNMIAFYLNGWKDKVPVPSLPPPTLEEELTTLQVSGFKHDSVDYPAMRLHYAFKSADYFHQNRKRAKMSEALLTIYNNYQRREMTVDTALILANHFAHYDETGLSYLTIEPFATQQNPNHDALSLYLKLIFSHPEEKPKSTYYQQLIDAKKVLTDDEWCELFIGPCKISFQILDHPELRELYCETCGNKGNYVTQRGYKK